MSHTTSLRPGLMVCCPSLHEATPANAETFMRWTKLHFRELLNLSVSDRGGSITRTLRFVAPNATGKPGDYFYTILSTDIPFWHTPAYHARSNRLDLENTRDLEAGEEAVGCEEGKMVWDACDAKFAIYEETQSDYLGIKSYQELPGLDRREQLITIGMPGSKAEVRKLHANLVERVRSAFGESVTLYSSVYVHGGEEAHPDMHPKIDSDRIGGGEWLMLVLIVDEEDKSTTDGLTEKLVGEWVKENGTAEMKCGVWYGEVDLS